MLAQASEHGRNIVNNASLARRLRAVRSKLATSLELIRMHDLTVAYSQ